MVNLRCDMKGMELYVGRGGEEFRWWWLATGVVVVRVDDTCWRLFSTYVGHMVWWCDVG